MPDPEIAWGGSPTHHRTKLSTQQRYLDNKFLVTDRPIETLRLDELDPCLPLFAAMAERHSHADE